jgi:hypothetical protein
MTASKASTPALTALAMLVGEWTMEVDIPGVPAGRAVFEWALDGNFLVQRNEIPHPDFPDSQLIVGASSDSASSDGASSCSATGATFFQHYFDSRGVARIYQMEFGDGKWTLLRNTPDFEPLDFQQRFTGEIVDNNTINGGWEHSADGETWEHDFTLSYYRVVQL